MKIKRYSEWLNESEEIFSFEPKFPWEKDVVSALHKIESLLDKIESFEYQRYADDTISLNIKIKNYPDISALANNFNVTEEFCENKWNNYIEMLLRDFKEYWEEEGAWIENISQSGRSGGWLTISFKKLWAPNRVQNQLQNLLEDYIGELEGVEPATEKEISNMKTASLASKFGLDSSERIEELKNAKKRSEDFIKTLTPEIQDLEKIISDIENIKKEIEDAQATLSQDFQEYLKEEIA